MEIRLFQIIVPLLAVFFMVGLIVRFRKSKITVYEMTIGNGFWLTVLLVALFPDFFSNYVARFFGIKSNVNAIIFFCIGLLFFIQFKMYFIIRKQEKDLTELTRRLALAQNLEGKRG